MARLPPIDYATAGPEAQAEHDRELSLRGRMTHMKRIMLHSPAAHRIYAEWFTLRDLLRPAVSERALTLLCLAMAEESRAVVPQGFFRRALITAGETPDDIVPTVEEAELIAFGRASARTAHQVPDALWQPLAARYDTTTLVNLVAFTGLMAATTLFTNVLAVDPDPELIPVLSDHDRRP